MARGQITAFKAGAFTPAGYAQALRVWGKAIEKPITNAMRRGLHYARGLAIDEFAQHGLGRGIFGKKRSSARAIVKRTKVVHRGNAFVGGLWVKGLGALQERGGRTRAHDIRPTNAKVLRLKVPSLGMTYRKKVHHPGGRVHAHPFLQAALEKAEPRILAEMEKELRIFTTLLGVA